MKPARFIDGETLAVLLGGCAWLVGAVLLVALLAFVVRVVWMI